MRPVLRRSHARLSTGSLMSQNASWIPKLYKRWLSEIRKHEDRLFLVLTLLIGAVVGLVVVAFIVLTERIGSKMYPAGGAAWRRLAVPVAGSLITGYLLSR